MIEKYDDITPADNNRYNEIAVKIDNGESISAEDARFFSEFNTAVMAAQIELQARADAIKLEAETRAREISESERIAREGYELMVNAALAKYERVRSAVVDG